MEKKKIIPCLDIKNGKVVKGVKFVGLQEVGTPVAFAKKYSDQGADEIVFLDISATLEGRSIMLDVIKDAAKELSIPLCVGGGINNLDDIEATLKAGASKVSLNSAALKNPQLIKDAVSIYGSQAIVVAIDAKLNQDNNTYEVYSTGGSLNTGYSLLEWASIVQNSGAGSILLTSIDADGSKAGYDLKMIEQLYQSIPMPIIASGGCGSIDDIITLFENTNASAALVASLFHYNEA
ncbi:MAG: imidazole glycerol phosphate synthase subunit HisF, partial [Bacilli bacterium]